MLPVQVADWLNFVVGRVDSPPVSMRRERPAERRRGKKKRGPPGGTSEEEGAGLELYNSGSGRVSNIGLF